MLFLLFNYKFRSGNESSWANTYLSNTLESGRKIFILTYERSADQWTLQLLQRKQLIRPWETSRKKREVQELRISQVRVPILTSFPNSHDPYPVFRDLRRHAHSNGLHVISYAYHRPNEFLTVGENFSDIPDI